MIWMTRKAMTWLLAPTLMMMTVMMTMTVMMMMMNVSGNEWNSENCFSESENATREGIGGSSLRSNLSKSPVEEYWE